MTARRREEDMIIVRVIISLDTKHNFITHLYLRAFRKHSLNIYLSINILMWRYLVLSHFDSFAESFLARLSLSRSSTHVERSSTHALEQLFSGTEPSSTFDKKVSEKKSGGEEKPIIVFSLEFHYPFTRA
jgi:hypothetical protein